MEASQPVHGSPLTSWARGLFPRRRSGTRVARRVSAACCAGPSAAASHVPVETYRACDRLVEAFVTKSASYPETATILRRLHPDLVALVREGDGAAAPRIVDAILGVDPAALNRARLVFRTRRIAARAGCPA